MGKVLAALISLAALALVITLLLMRGEKEGPPSPAAGGGTSEAGVTAPEPGGGETTGGGGGETRAPQPGGEGAVSIRAVFVGTPPAPARHSTGEFAEPCGAPAVEDRTLRVAAAGGVADVVVELLRDGVAVEPSPEPVPFGQQGCVFAQPVVVVTEGSTVLFTNSDGVEHNVRMTSIPNRLSGEARAVPPGGLPLTLARRDRIEVTCSLHAWMRAALVVTGTPYHALTAEDGAARLEGVPAGAWRIRVWHPSRDVSIEAPKEVVVPADGAAALEIRLSPR